MSRSPVRRPARLATTAFAALALGAVGAVTTGVSTAGPASADTCLPIPGLPCLPDLPIPGTQAPTATSPVKITGTPKVGMKLTATPPTWSDESTTTTYRWQRAGTDIAGATEATYTLVGDDLAQKITVVATGTVGLASGTSTSDPVTVVVGDAPKPGITPVVSGTPAVGQKLTVKPGTWSGGDPQPTFTYQWYRSTKAGAAKITGATAATYEVATADTGAQLAAVVTATKKGFKDGSAVSQVVRVAKAASSITLSLPARTVKASKQAKASFVVGSATTDPTGKVVVKDGAKTLLSYQLGSGDAGAVTVTLPRLAVGRHQLTAIYAGDGSLARSTSRAVVLTVTR